jgi:uncharacterized SAM-binding protein YcdF (DUF218 family)
LRRIEIRRQPRARRPGHVSAPRRRKRPRWLGRAIVLASALIVGSIAWAIIARALAPRSNTTLERFDVLIVLGYPADTDGNPSPTQLARVTEAVHEYERGVAPRMILTGGAARNQFVEAQVMARTAEGQGIPASQILEDTQARNTIENTCNSLRIMRSHGWDSAEVISSPSHLPRAALILSHLPLQWRVRAAPPLGPVPAYRTALASIEETLKTVHYLVWSRETESCSF